MVLLGDDSGISRGDDDERVILPLNAFGPCSLMPVLCPGEGDGGRQR